MATFGQFSVTRLASARCSWPAYGPPPERPDEALPVSVRPVDAGISHIGIAEYCRPTVLNALIREPPHPYRTTSSYLSEVGARRDGSGEALRHDQRNHRCRGIEDSHRTRRSRRGGESSPDGFGAQAPTQRPGTQFDARLAAMVSVRNGW
jgi:hypothetical protein